jgi:hypothetical protein
MPKLEDKGDTKLEDKGDTKLEDKGAGLLSHSSSLGAGCSWVVVAFIGPSSIGANELAASILGGTGSRRPSTRKSKLGDAAVLAQAASRKRAAARAQLLEAADANLTAFSSKYLSRKKQ